MDPSDSAGVTEKRLTILINLLANGIPCPADLISDDLALLTFHSFYYSLIVGDPVGAEKYFKLINLPGRRLIDSMVDLTPNGPNRKRFAQLFSKPFTYLEICRMLVYFYFNIVDYCDEAEDYLLMIPESQRTAQEFNCLASIQVIKNRPDKKKKKKYYHLKALGLGSSQDACYLAFIYQEKYRSGGQEKDKLSTIHYYHKALELNHPATGFIVSNILNISFDFNLATKYYCCLSSYYKKVYHRVLQDHIKEEIDLLDYLRSIDYLGISDCLDISGNNKNLLLLVLSVIDLTNRILYN